MRGFAAGFVAVLFSGGAAHALECDKATLSSSKVLCSDPDLKALADERQDVWFGTWKRLSPQQQKALMADQNGWVKSYAEGCGIAPDRAPKLPISAETKQCFMDAGRARVAYLREYGRAVSAAPQPEMLGPSHAYNARLSDRDAFEYAQICSSVVFEVNEIVEYTRTFCAPTSEQGKMALLLVPTSLTVFSSGNGPLWATVALAAAATISEQHSVRPNFIVLGDPSRQGEGVVLSYAYVSSWHSAMATKRVSGEEAIADLANHLNFRRLSD